MVMGEIRDLRHKNNFGYLFARACKLLVSRRQSGWLSECRTVISTILSRMQNGPNAKWPECRMALLVNLRK